MLSCLLQMCAMWHALWSVERNKKLCNVHKVCQVCFNLMSMFQSRDSGVSRRCNHCHSIQNMFQSNHAVLASCFLTHLGFCFTCLFFYLVNINILYIIDKSTVGSVVVIFGSKSVHCTCVYKFLHHACIGPVPEHHSVCLFACKKRNYGIERRFQGKKCKICLILSKL